MLQTVSVQETTIQKKKAITFFDLDTYVPNTIRNIIVQSNKKTLEGELTIDDRIVKFNLTDLVNWELTEAISGFWLSLFDECTSLYVMLFTEPVPEFTYFAKKCSMKISNTGTSDATVKGSLLLGRKEVVYEEQLLQTLIHIQNLFEPTIPIDITTKIIAPAAPPSKIAPGDSCTIPCYPPLMEEFRNLANCVNKILSMVKQ